MKRSKPWTHLCLALPLLALLPSCQSLYLMKQGFKNFGVVGGALEIQTGASGEISVESVELSPGQQRKLVLINEIREFAATELELEVGDAYRTYYEVPKDAVSYVVTAAHPLALVPYQWRFPVVGRVNYKGFFDLDDAKAERDRLHDRGWDTHLGPVAAFSSLGWFDDPVLSTMLDYLDGALADLIIHELAHRTVYFKNLTDVNESMATVIGRRGARLFLIQKFSEDSEEIREFNEDLRQRSMRDEILRRLRFDLDALYRSSLDRQKKLAHKEQFFALASRLLYPQAEAPETVLPRSNAFVTARREYAEHVTLFEQVLGIFGGEPAGLMAFLKSLPESEDPLPALRRKLAHLEDIRGASRNTRQSSRRLSRRPSRPYTPYEPPLSK